MFEALERMVWSIMTVLFIVMIGYAIGGIRDTDYSRYLARDPDYGVKSYKQEKSHVDNER
jgi:hypothetical protein